ncbi:MAG: molybdopterin-dependent oxidoreductase [Syntrophobacteraceae bacterium]|jgi:formate dehydrogenase alpha subunit|nr:molybdopterin-dependent oxidoreductase [Syntrophobacteraceae bacterium]
MAKVTLKINGQEVEVEKGTTILEAAKEIGVYIPVLCYHPNLPLEEACRICVVEDVRGSWSTLVAGCVFPCRNGMVIETDSEMVMDARRTIMNLLLSDHPNDCMTCYAAGECELQDMAHLYGIKGEGYKGERHKYPVDYDKNAYLFLDMNKCILCRRCIRACHDIEGADIWTKVGRGFNQRISTAFELPLEDAGCEFCGHCADFCPVDAIGFRGGRGQVRSWQLRKTSTVCLQCASGCRASYETIDGKVVRVRGDFNSPANSGALCKLGRFNFNFINSPERLTEASVKGSGPVSLEEALNAAAAGLEKVRESAGGSAIGVLCGGMLTNEEYYMAQKLARGALSTNNVDNVAGPWQQAIYDGLSNSLGMGAMTNTLDDIARARAVLVLGSNTLEKHAIAALRARKARREEGVALIVAHPEAVPLTKTASMHLKINSGTEDQLLLGLLKVVVAEELFKQEYLDNYTQDLQKLTKSLEKVNLAEVAEKTGIGEEQIREAARLYASQSPACLVYGVDHGSPKSEGFYRMCAALQLLLGSVGVAGGGVCVMGGAGNAQGAADFGAVPKYLTGYRPATSSAARKVVGKLWGAELADKAGLSWPEMFEAIEKGELKALHLVGVDPFELGIPKEKVIALLGRLEFLVVQDCVANEASKMAHVVLPASSFIEKEGTATNCERRVQSLEKAMDSPGAASSDFELINGLLGILKPELKAESLGSAFVEAVQLITELSGVEPGQIAVDGLQWPVTSAGSGTERLGLPEDGKVKFRFFAARI